MEPLTEDQQAHVDKLIGDARTKARDKATKSADEKQAKEQATSAAVAAQARKDLEALNEAKTAVLEEMAQGMLDDAIGQMGVKAKTAVEGLPSSMVAIEKLKWLRANEKLFRDQGDQVGTPKGSNSEQENGVQPQNNRLRM